MSRISGVEAAVRKGVDREARLLAGLRRRRCRPRRSPPSAPCSSRSAAMHEQHRRLQRRGDRLAGIDRAGEHDAVDRRVDACSSRGRSAAASARPAAMARLASAILTALAARSRAAVAVSSAWSATMPRFDSCCGAGERLLGFLQRGAGIRRPWPRPPWPKPRRRSTCAASRVVSSSASTSPLLTRSFSSTATGAHDARQLAGNVDLGQRLQRAGRRNRDGEVALCGRHGGVDDPGAASPRQPGIGASAGAERRRSRQAHRASGAGFALPGGRWVQPQRRLDRDGSVSGAGLPDDLIHVGRAFLALWTSHPCKEIMRSWQDFKLNFAPCCRLRREPEMKRATCSKRKFRRLRRVFEQDDLPAIRWPWCSMPDGLDDAGDAGHRRRVQPVGDGVHPAAAEPGASRQCAHLHADARTALRRPSDRRRGDRPRRGGRRRRRRRSSCWRRRSGRCAAPCRRARTAMFAEFDLPRLPEPVAFSGRSGGGRAPRSASTPHEIGFENHVVSAYSGGVPYILVPVAGLDAAARASLDTRAWMELTGPAEALSPAAFVYCRETVGSRQRLPCAHVRRPSRHSGRPGDRLGGGVLCRRDHALRPAGRRRQPLSDRARRRDGPAVADPAGARRQAGQRSPARASAAMRSRSAKGAAAASEAVCTAAPKCLSRRGWTGRWSASISRRSPQGGCGCVAQLVEQLTLNQRVTGSIPVAPTKS